MSTPELSPAQRPFRAPSAPPLSRGLAPLALTLGLLPLGLVACQPPGESDPAGQVDAAVRERKLPRILAEPLRRQEMVAVRETTCTLESEFEVSLMPRIAARVIALRAEEGDRVQAGDVLVELEQTDQALALRDAEIAVQEAEQELENTAIAIDEANSRLKGSQLALDQAKRDYERDAELSRGGSSGVASVSQKAFEQSQLAYTQAQQDLAQAELALSRAQLDQKKATTAVDRAVVARDRAAEELAQTRLRAPFDGVIAERLVRVGQMSSTAESAFTLTDPDRLRAVFFRPQRELGLFASALSSDAPPLELTATTDALPELVFAGSIQRVSPTIDPTSGNFRVTASIDPVPMGGDRAELLPGMLLRVRIVTDRHENALVVPKRAVQREGGESFVFELAADPDGGHRAVRVPVIEGFTSEDDVEITPVEAGRIDLDSTIITVGARDLSDGDAVEWVSGTEDVEESIAGEATVEESIEETTESPSLDGDAEATTPEESGAALDEAAGTAVEELGAGQAALEQPATESTESPEDEALEPEAGTPEENAEAPAEPVSQGDGA
ncbi:MAG: efflux RND transporter periplasmic adaptor subunit [Planctomycetota bacterium]